MINVAEQAFLKFHRIDSCQHFCRISRKSFYIGKWKPGQQLFIGLVDLTRGRYLLLNKFNLTDNSFNSS